MKRWFLPVLCVTFVVLYGTTCWKLGKNVEQQKLEKAAYHKTADSLTVQLVAARTHRDTLVRKIPVEVLKIVHDSAKADTAKHAVIVADASGDSLHMIRARDTVIAAQDTLIRSQYGNIRTLSGIIAADSGIARLYVIQRNTDSTRIRVLEKQQRGPTILGLRLPRLRCVAGPVITVYPQQNVGVGAACGLGF